MPLRRLRITADMRLQPSAFAKILASLGLLISAKRYIKFRTLPLKEVNKEQIAKIPKTVRSWLGYLLIILLVEKVIQHVVVTVSFFYNIGDIRSKVAIDYNFLMVSGAIVAALFAIAFLGTVKNKKWGIILASALAMFDIVGEFVAQGTISITITVSIIVAIILLVLCYCEYQNFYAK